MQNARRQTSQLEEARDHQAATDSCAGIGLQHHSVAHRKRWCDGAHCEIKWEIEG
jgi:hypothetical protein